MSAARSAKPNSTVSIANKSQRRVRKVEILQRGSEATAASAEAHADQKRHPVFFERPEDKGEDSEGGEAPHAHGAGP